jgi:hypothetical protein
MTLFSQGYRPKWIQPPKPGPRRGNFQIAKRYGFLSLDTDRIAYVTQASESAFVVSQNEDLPCEVKLEILKENYEHSDDRLYVAFEEHNSSMLGKIISRSLPKEEVILPHLTIEFEVRHFYFDSLVKAVNRITPMIIKRLLPISADFFRLLEFPDEYFDSLLASIPRDLTIDRRDKDQFYALRKVLSCDPKSPPVIINGSFGTGKTRLLAVITHCIIQHGKKRRLPVRVLICAHHQASADHFIDNYFDRMFGGNSGVLLVRMVSSTHHNVKSGKFQHVYWTWKDYMHNASLSLPQYLVIVTTFLTAPTLSNGREGDFTHILLDEGSQSREPEAISPLSLAGPDTKLVIAGDSKQVSIYSSIKCDNDYSSLTL